MAGAAAPAPSSVLADDSAAALHISSIPEPARTSTAEDRESKAPSSILSLEPAAIPSGALDPVYEAKARILNHAVCRASPSPPLMRS
jgi:hypothetical protein